jgi:hypothetical protein
LPPPPREPPPAFSPQPPQSQSKGKGFAKDQDLTDDHKGSGKEGQGNRNSDGEQDIHFINGMQEGFQKGFEKGRRKGYSKGYSKGYADSVALATEAEEEGAEWTRRQTIIAKKGHDLDLDSQPPHRVVDKKRHDDWGLDNGGGKVGGKGRLLKFEAARSAARLTPHAPHRSESDPAASSSQRQPWTTWSSKRRGEVARSERV